MIGGYTVITEDPGATTRTGYWSLSRGPCGLVRTHQRGPSRRHFFPEDTRSDCFATTHSSPQEKGTIPLLRRGVGSIAKAAPVMPCQ